MQDGSSGGAAGGPVEGRALRAAYYLAYVLILFYGLVYATPNAFVIDGSIYYAMADAMAHHGAFGFWNGYATYHSPSLTLRFAVPRDGLLMPQYPGGWAILAAPFFLLGGVKGLFLLNTLATLATIGVVRATALELFGKARAATVAALIYAFCTFAFDYAGAIWPHAPTVLGISLATWAAARAWRRAAPGWALAAGLAIGISIHFRVDAILAAPAIALWLIAATGRPWASLGAFAAGLAPGLAAASAINYLKFGALSPITYGRAGAGDATIGRYLVLLPLPAVAVVAALALRVRRLRDAASRPRVVLGLAVLAAVLCLLPPLSGAALRLLAGAGALVLDVQTFHGALRPAMLHQMPDGTFQIFGYYKKALVQSLPWLAGCLVLAPRLLRGPDRAAYWLLVLIPLAILVPLAWRAWVGGLANHMRYMVNTFPALSILGAMALDRLAAEPGRARAGARLVALAAGAAAVAAGLVLGYGGGHGTVFTLQNRLPDLLAAVLALASVALLAGGDGLRARLAPAVRGLFVAGLAVAFVSAWGLDLALHQARRHDLQRITEAADKLPANAVIQGVFPTAFFDRIGKKPGLVAVTMPSPPYYDPKFIRRVMAEGRPVYIQNKVVADNIVRDGLAAAAKPLIGIRPSDDLYHLIPPS